MFPIVIYTWYVILKISWLVIILHQIDIKNIMNCDTVIY
jgi:hypothetical protein